MFGYFEPVKRAYDRSDVTGFRIQRIEKSKRGKVMVHWRISDTVQKMLVSHECLAAPL